MLRRESLSPLFYLSHLLVQLAYIEHIVVAILVLKDLSCVKTFGQEITDLDSRSDEQKKAYIEGLVKQIDVRWNAEEREHELTLTFFLPIVNDGITWREKEDYEGHGRRARRYDTYEGSTKTTLSAKKKDGRG